MAISESRLMERESFGLGTKGDSWMRMRRYTSVAAAAALALTIGACSSSSKSTSAPATVPVGSAGSTTTGSTTTGSTTVAGTPYKLMWAETMSSGGDKYVAAIEKGVDARGGIAGHPLQIVVCLDNNDANTATQCARQAVTDPDMLGIISNSSTCSSQVVPLLAQAHMASINDNLFCPEDFKSAQIFPLQCLGDDEASALGVKYFKDPDSVITTLDLPAGRQYAALVQSFVGPAGGKVSAGVYIPVTASDMAPYAEQIAAQKGVLFEGNTVAIGVRLGQALQSIGYNRPVIYNGYSWDPALIKSSFGNPTNAYLAEYYNESSPGWQMFLSDMHTYEPGVTFTAGDIVNAWSAANVVAEIAKTLPTVSAKTIFDKLSTETDLSTFGLTPPLNFTVPQKGFGGQAPRCFNPDVALYHYVNGSAVQVTPFENLLP